ncbi:MAG TPA: M55 family metallopeptidase [Vicinamibacteria bacterium]|nr:M55 family metallopeptidase [Vicinamibacteria bacterium]
MKAPLAATSLWLLAVNLHAAEPVKIFISADMEGLTGVVTGDQLGPTGFEYAAFREVMTAEVNAAIEAAREGGATELLVADSHGNMENLLLDKLPQDVQVVRSNPRPLGMMEGLDGTFAGVIFIGYHASTTNPRGVRAHTLSSATLADVRLGGVSMPEAGINAAIAGHFGVPVLAVSGDDAAVEETRALLGDVEGAVVKWATGFHSARTLTPAAGREVIKAAVKRAMARRAERKPYRVPMPAELEVRFKNYRPAEILALLPGVSRADAHSVRLTVKDAPEAARFLTFVTNYQATLEP